jgi:glycosyltransferase involved in cell wall biosynthesis
MDLAIYHPWLKEKGGAEKVVLESARRSSHDVTVYTQFYDEDETFEGFQDLEINVLGLNSPPRNFIDQGLRFGLGSLLKKIPLNEHDAFLVSEAGIGSLIALRNNSIPTLCYCHTPLRAALPEFRQTYLKEQPLPLKPVYWTGIKIYDLLEKRAWTKFDRILVNSDTTKRRILEKGIAHEEKLSIINPGADVEENQEGEFQKYFLYPSRFRRYKRQDLAIKAFKEADLEDFKLVLAGSNQEPEFVEELREMIDEEDNIEIRTDLPGDEWKELYRNCYSVLFLAEKEDWGIIPIEAGSHGKPTISVNEGGPKESVLEDETGLLVNPEAEGIAEAMKELAEDEEKTREMGSRAREESRKYSWDNFSEKLDEEVEKLVEEKEHE